MRLLLVNGAGVVRQLRRTLAENLTEVDRIAGLSRHPARFYAGRINHLRVIGWSTNLQSSWGVTSQLRAKLAMRVGHLAEMS